MTDKPKPTFELSVDTRLLYQRLAAAAMGEVVAYDDLNDLIGRDVRRRAYGALASARRKALAEDGIVFDVVPKVGMKRLTDAEIVASTQADVRRLHKASRRAARKVACAHYEQLPADSRITHNAVLSLFGAVHNITHVKRLKQLEQEVASTNGELPLAKTLAFFSK